MLDVTLTITAHRPANPRRGKCDYICGGEPGMCTGVRVPIPEPAMYDHLVGRHHNITGREAMALIRAARERYDQEGRLW